VTLPIGVSLSSSYRVDDPRDGARYMVEQAQAAAAAGLHSLTVGDHHVTPYPYYQNTPMLGRLLAEWDPARPAGCLFLLPLWHPVLVAEQVSTLAAIHRGPFVVQTGLGDGQREFAAMGRALARRGRDLDEAIRLVKALLAGETVDSDRFGLRGAAVSPQPAADQRVEWWIGAGASDAALDRAAREGAWYVGPNAPLAMVADLAARYRDRCAAHGTTPHIFVRRDVTVLDRAADAARAGGELVAKGYRGIPAEALVIGDVEQAAAQLAPLAALGVDAVIARPMSLPQELALETIANLGRLQ
jgi:alkanesulfonate monooxygenase SsuD/methylene tetrahydromethanopterin reductase-like flavin-dependent oxidoreductase (luciferase family)